MGRTPTAASPASGSDEDELTLGEQLVELAYRFADRQEVGTVLEPRVAVGVDVDDVGDVRHVAVGDESVGCEEGVFDRNVLGNRRGRVLVVRHDLLGQRDRARQLR